MRHRKTITIPKDRETLIREALCREEAVRLHRENEAVILDTLHPLEVPLPRFYPETRATFPLWRAIIRELTNLAKI